MEAGGRDQHAAARGAVATALAPPRGCATGHPGLSRSPMRWASTLSFSPEVTSAFEQAGGALEKQFGGAAPDLLIAFLSADHAPEAGRLAALARRRFPS